MPQNDRERQNPNRYNQTRSQQSSRRQDNRQQEDDWARQVPWTRGQEEYRDYGWERGESALPEFRDPDTHIQPYERQQVSRWHRVRWNQDYNYGVEEEGPYSGVGPKGYQRSDERILDDVCERLTRHGQIDAHDIQVNVTSGEVTLSGTVNDRHTKRMVEDITENVRGVKDIHNQLHINQQMGGQQSGMPGGGRGRVDRVGRSGVYPASGPWPDQNAPVQGEASWGQGDRGAAGYQDSGRSEIPMQPEQGKQQNQQQSQGQQEKKQ